ncbi:hypothetical protein [Paraflavitalea speifideaquila]|uniref:hypothetical protein n=1 Tax=Paraflavitalea speifideaquila TaxID=3076558 RepID=UPI0028F0B23E|nr:hypothetical protein [Paraflavitalea speifideiaquila]
MRKLVYIFLFGISSLVAQSQSIVNNSFYPDIDDFNTIDTLIGKNKISYVEIYSCSAPRSKTDSCALVTKINYDSKGRMIKLIKGSDLLKGKTDYKVQFDKISDTLFQGIAWYPANSTMIPDDIFIDTLVRGSAKKCAYTQKTMTGI